jgi:hypothetical protein
MNEVHTLKIIKESYIVNIKLSRQYSHILQKSRLVNEMEFVYINFLINGIYKVLKKSRMNAITLDKVLNDEGKRKDKDLLKYMNDCLEIISKRYKDILNQRSKIVAHIDYNYVKSNDYSSINIEKVLKAIDDIYGFYQDFLIEYFDDYIMPRCNIDQDIVIESIINIKI